MNRPFLKSATLALAVLVSLAGCAPADGEGSAVHADGQASAPAADHTGHGTGVPALDPTDMSLYHLAATWLDQHGEERTLASLAGRPRAVAMVYTHCSVACPQIVLDLMRLEAAAPAGSLGLVLVSMDPERDTPERLAEFASQVGLAPDRWTLLTGDETGVRALAALLGVQYRRTGNEFDHSNIISLLDAEGVVAHRQEGLGADNSATLAALVELLAEG